MCRAIDSGRYANTDDIVVDRIDVEGADNGNSQSCFTDAG